MANTPHVLAQNAAAMPSVMLYPVGVVGAILLAYLIGSIPFGVLLAKLYKVGDLRKVGSGNIGATNMLRAGGSRLAAATLALDMAKGVVAVLAGSAFLQLLLPHPSQKAAESMVIDAHSFVYITGFYAVVGHVFPVWLRGKGGKGVATALGVLLAYSLPVGVLTLSAWLAVFALTLYSSLSALVAIALSPIFCGYFIGRGAAIAASFTAALVFYRHKENIRRLRAGEEPKSTFKKSA